MKKYLGRIKRYILLEILFDVLCTLALATVPQLHRLLFDEGTRFGFAGLRNAVLLYGLLHVFYVVFTYLCMLVTWKGASEFERGMKKDFFSALSHLPRQAFHQRPVGEYISLMSNDITAIEQDYLQPLIDVIRSINMIIIYSVYLFLWVDWRIALTLLAASLITVIGPRLTGALAAKHRKEYQDEAARYTAQTTDLLDGFSLIDSRTREKITGVHEESLRQTSQKRYRYGKTKSASLAINEMAVKTIQIAAFAVTGFLLMRGDISFGIGVSVFGYIESYLRPINSLLYDVNAMASVREVKARFLTYVNAQPQESRPELTQFRETLSLHHVTLRYEHFSMEDVSFSFQKRKKYAIIGGNGSGKSTLLKLIKGHLSPDEGFVAVDGNPLSDFDTSALISYAEQHDHIFRADYVDNATVFHSYSQAQLAQLVSQLHQKLSGVIGAMRNAPNAKTLSGGEQQALLLMRSLLRDAEIVLLDEAFSAVDQATRAVLEEYLFAAQAGKTLLCVTHQLDESLERYDEIVILQHGKIVRHGAYEAIRHCQEYVDILAHKEEGGFVTI